MPRRGNLLVEFGIASPAKEIATLYREIPTAFGLGMT